MNRRRYRISGLQATKPDVRDARRPDRRRGESRARFGRAGPARRPAVSHDLLPMLGIHPIVGRHFTADEDQGERPTGGIDQRVALGAIARPRSRRRGLDLRLNERPYTIVGVVADAADFGVLQILTRAACAGPSPIEGRGSASTCGRRCSRTRRARPATPTRCSSSESWRPLRRVRAGRRR